MPASIPSAADEELSSGSDFMAFNSGQRNVYDPILDDERLLPVQPIRFVPQTTSLSHLVTNNSLPTMTTNNWLEPRFYPNNRLIPIVIILGTLDLLTFVGNALLIVAVMAQPSLRRSAFNRTIVSMAVTGVLVSIFVMPMSLLNEISQVWFLGDVMCTVFTILDVNFCTASIFHLVSIAIDRYLSATRIHYFHQRRRWINSMLVASWVGSALLSLLPVMGWRDPDLSSSKTGQCLVSGDPSFAIFGTTIAFYIPTLFIIGVYVRIYIEVRRRIRKHLAMTVPLNELRDSLTARQRTSSNSMRPSKTETDSYYLPSARSYSVSAVNKPEMRRASSLFGFGETTTNPTASNGKAKNGSKRRKPATRKESLPSVFSSPPNGGIHHSRTLSGRTRRVMIGNVNGKAMAPLLEHDNELPPSPCFTKELRNNKDSAGNGAAAAPLPSLVTSGSNIASENNNSNNIHKTESSKSQQTACLGKDLRQRIAALKKTRKQPRRVSVAMALMAMATDHCSIFDQSYTPQSPDLFMTPTTSPAQFLRRSPLSPGNSNKNNEPSSKDDSGIARTNSIPPSTGDALEFSLMSSDELTTTTQTTTTAGKASMAAGDSSMAIAANSADLAATLVDRSVLWKQRERKMAAISLSVTLAFIICWLPYFLLELAIPLCGCYYYLPAHPLVRTAVNWLGYCNSLLNPFIYTLSSVEFRNAFRAILKI